jgi:hypothetical protein
MVRSLPVMEVDPPRQQAEAASLRRHRQAIELYEKIQEYAAKHVDLTAIAQHVGASRRTVYRYLQMTEPPPGKQIPSTRKKLIEAYQPYLVKRWNEGVRNSQQRWREHTNPRPGVRIVALTSCGKTSSLSRSEHRAR